jgi:hypothetical protein
MLNIYGAPDYLNNIYDIFSRLIKNHAWIFTERAVWRRGEKYIYTDYFATPGRLGDKLVGIEIQIVGAGAVLYFAQEGGMHVWVDRDQEDHCYAVLMVQCGLDKFRTPDGVHRKKFLEGLETRREYWKNGFLVDKTTHTGSNWQSVLEKQLDDNFRELLRGVLCGDMTEIEEFFDDDFSLDDFSLDDFSFDDIPF